MHSTYQQQAQQIVYEHTKKILHGHIAVVFYDLATLYFEAEEEDDLRRIGFSKDGKFTCPQILLGLLVGESGYPIGYDIFEGNTFEGHLWQIEKAFRISKTDLRIRPMFHHKRERIEAHICIAFAAYAIYKELERLLQANGVQMSPKRAAGLTQTMYEIEYVLPGTKEVRKQVLKMDKEQQVLHDAIFATRVSQ